MDKDISERYSLTEDGKMIIDIATEKIEDLYDDFDKFVPFLKKELDHSLVEYLIDSVNEIGKNRFVIQFSLTKMPDGDQVARVKSSVNKYFLYLKELESRELKRMMRTSVIFLVAGIMILTVSVWVNQQILGAESVFKKVFAEGLTVAAWISLWEALANFLIYWAPQRRQIKLYERIADADISLKEASSPQ